MRSFKGKTVCVVGFGKSGQAAARYLTAQGAQVIVNDSKSKQELNDALKNFADLKLEYDLGKHSAKSFETAEAIVLSPGVPHNIEGLAEAKARGIPVINDIDLVMDATTAPIIAVTGTNGKTTTTTMIADMLKLDGKKVFVGGNIGTPALEFTLKGENPEVIVLEVSSFQLESIDTFKPNVAVITNLEPNHLDRYPEGLESYYNAKKRIVKNADTNTLLITNLENPKTAAMADGFVGKFLGFTKKNPMTINPELAETFKGAYIQRPKMVFKNLQLLDGKTVNEDYSLMTMKLPGDHNRENLMAAALAARAVGCSPVSIQKIIDTFKGVSHRLEFIRKKDGVYFYNDSKSTSVPAMKTAIGSFMAPIILIAGGRDKDQEFGPLADIVHKKVKNLILLGESKEKINRSIGDYSETFLVGTFEEAVLLAYQKSRNGDVILLSPGCTSYDMFKNFEERGDYFKKLVAQL